MSTTITPRFDLGKHAGGPLAAMRRVEERIELDPTIRELVTLRASFVNGCAFCIDMHWADARANGESEERLAQVAAWHESPFFTSRERAALTLTDAVTDVGGTHVPDDAWDEAARHFDQDELAHLVFQIGAINLWNRVVVSARAVPASYAPHDGVGE